jgi:hypothetical protein
MSDTPADPSGHAKFLRQLERSPGTPPEATSTPQGSIHLPSQLQFQSNLLEQDLDMQKAMKDFDSLEDDSGRSQRSCKLFIFDNYTSSQRLLQCHFLQHRHHSLPPRGPFHMHRAPMIIQLVKYMALGHLHFRGTGARTS